MLPMMLIMMIMMMKIIIVMLIIIRAQWSGVKLRTLDYEDPGLNPVLRC